MEDSHKTKETDELSRLLIFPSFCQYANASTTGEMWKRRCPDVKFLCDSANLHFISYLVPQIP